MRWLWKALLLAALLAWPGTVLAPAYQALLLALTGFVTGIPLAAPADGQVDLSAANLLMVFVALCLASDFAPRSRRVRTVLIGIPVLIAIEVLSGIAGITLARGAGGAGAGPGTLAVFVQQSLELSRWLAVPLVWAALLGRERLAALMGVHGIRPEDRTA